MPLSEWKETTLGEEAYFSTDKIPLDKITLENYISTENMLQDRGGVCLSSGLPTTGGALKYSVGDTLISNIRPYFKKIWLANKNGGCSNDVLVIKSNSMDSKYKYYLLS